MKLVTAGWRSDLVASYITDKTGATFQPGMYQAFAILNNKDDFCGAVIVSNFREHDCELSCASETGSAWSFKVIHDVFDYVFNQLGCVRCTAITKKGNKKARAFLEGMGFQLEGNLRLGYDGIKDALIYGLLASECRYLAKETDDGQEEWPESASSAGPSQDSGGTGGVEYQDGDSERQPKPH